VIGVVPLRLLHVSLHEHARQAPDRIAIADDVRAVTRFFLDWTPEPTGIPTLLVRATERTDRMPAENWSAAWPTPHESVSAPGNHFTLLEEHAASTAAAIRTWIAGLRT
jgi:thioesterase domain-containing protein